ncbi:MAG: hypothetical protein IJI65_01300 [Lachnospiraceae bacterium]|nr:hypothetical protein [Lachnospiraceae bacterium]
MELHSKDRFKKVDITDIAIKKVPRISYKGLTEEQNGDLQKLAQLVLLKSKLENNSNEYAATVSLNNKILLDQIGFAEGDEHGVKVHADTDSHHIIVSAKDVSVVIIHNHPSTQTLSIEDIGFFLYETTVRILVVVTNQGTVHYIMKDTDYDHHAAEKLRRECTEDLTKWSSERECYEAALDFLTHCSEVGLYYR